MTLSQLLWTKYLDNTPNLLKHINTHRTLRTFKKTHLVYIRYRHTHIYTHKSVVDPIFAYLPCYRLLTSIRGIVDHDRFVDEGHESFIICDLFVIDLLILFRSKTFLYFTR